MKKEYLIWSIEHDLWWGKNHRGYTHDISNAGKYSIEEAKEIVDGANVYGSFNECKIPIGMCGIANN